MKKALVLAQVEDLDDVRVVELRGDPRLVQEHLDELAFSARCVEDALDDHELLEALEPDLARQPDLRHAADGEPR